MVLIFVYTRRMD